MRIALLVLTSIADGGGALVDQRYHVKHMWQVERGLCCFRHFGAAILEVVLDGVNLHSRHVHEASCADRSVSHVRRYTILEAREDAKIGASLLTRPVERLHVARPRAATLNLRHYVDEHTLADR